MGNSGPQIGLLIEDCFPDEPFEDFVNETASTEVSVEIVKRPTGTVYLSIEWLVPPAILVIIAGAYFNGLVGAIAADHYNILKKSTSKLLNNFRKTKATLVGSTGKVGPYQPYNLAFAIEVGATDGLVFKFMLQNDLSETDQTTAIQRFLEFVKDFHEGSLNDSTIEKLHSYNVRGSRILVCFDHKNGALRLINIEESREQPKNNELVFLNDDND